jgi:hypothetical protein
VNLENATQAKDLDAAIADFESIVNPANQPHDRHFDFSKDYVVLARLGQAVFKRSQLEAEGSDARRRFLLKAAEYYEQALEVDPEDLDAHYGISQAYATMPAHPKHTKSPADATPGALRQLSAQATDPTQPASQRITAATELGAAIEAYGEGPLKPQEPKLPVLRELVAQLRPSFKATTDPALQDALATALAKLHLEFWRIFRPDENARARVSRIYRSQHAAANLAAEAIVIYPTTPK